MKGLFIHIITILSIGYAYSQPPPGVSGKEKSTNELSIFPEIDTAITNYYFIGTDKSLIAFSDTTLDNFFQQYDPVRSRDIDYISLGNQGSSAFSQEYTFQNNIGYDYGFHQYDIYKKNLNTTKFFNVNRPFNDLFFSPMAGQRNFIVKGLFADNYADNVTFSIDFERINQDGFYNNQFTKSTSLGVNFEWAPSDKYQLYFNFFTNNHNEEINGGVTTDTLFNEPFFDIRENIPTILDSASTRHESRNYHLNQFLKLTNDSTLIDFGLHHHLRLSDGYIRFYDNGQDSLENNFYNSFKKDSRGIRYFMNFFEISNHFDISTALSDKVNLVAGIQHNYHRIKTDINSFSVNNILLQGSLVFTPPESINLQSKLQIGFLRSAGNLLLENQLVLDVYKGQKLKLGFNFSRYNPSYIQDELILTESIIWENEFSKVIESEIWGAIDIPYLKSSVKFSQMLIDNSIFLNASSFYEQNNNVLSITKLIFRNNLNFRGLHLRNTILLQNFSENLYFHLPELWTKHIAFVEFRIFRSNLLTRIGFEGRFTPSKNASNYNPFLGQLYQSNETIEFYPEIDFFSTFQIDQFRLFIRLENISGLVRNDILYEINNYPQFDFRFRLGIRWVLSD